MGVECKDCISIQSLKEQISTLEKNTNDKIEVIRREMEDSKTQRSQHEKDISELKTSQSTTSETVGWIKESIADIKSDIKSIANTLENMNRKGSMTFESLKYKVLEYCVLAVVAFVVLKLTKVSIGG